MQLIWGEAEAPGGRRYYYNVGTGKAVWRLRLRNMRRGEEGKGGDGAAKSARR